MRDFCIPRIEDYPDSLKALFLDNDSPSIVFWNYPQGHPEQKMDTIDRDRNDILFVDHGARAISLFHTRQYSENDAVFKVKMNKYFEQAKEKEKE